MNFNFNGSREIEHVRDMHMDFASRSMKLDLNILHKIEMNILEYLWTFFMFFLDIKHYKTRYNTGNKIEGTFMRI